MIEVGDTEVVENLLISIKNCVLEVFRRFDASNGTIFYGDLKIIILNREATEAETKKKSGSNTFSEFIDKMGALENELLCSIFSIIFVC